MSLASQADGGQTRQQTSAPELHSEVREDERPRSEAGVDQDPLTGRQFGEQRTHRHHQAAVVVHQVLMVFPVVGRAAGKGRDRIAPVIPVGQESQPNVADRERGETGRSCVHADSVPPFVDRQSVDGVAPSRRASSPSTSTRHLDGLTTYRSAVRRPDRGDDGSRVQIKSKLGVLFQVLGGVRVTVDGLDLDITGQPRRLLGILIAERDRVVSTDLLIERLWPDDAPATAAKVVHVLVGRLRRALEPELERATDSKVIRKAAGGYVLTTGPTDLDEYLELVAAATAERDRGPGAALALATEALGLWIGRSVG